MRGDGERLQSARRGFGGGIENSGTLTITNSTVSNNTGNGASSGGGIDSFAGVLTLTNITVSGNVAANAVNTNNNAGGIGLYTGSTGTITDSTITNNSIGNGGATAASGIFGAATLKNTIVAANVNNTTFPDVSTGNATSAGNNFIGSTTNANFVNGANGNQVGTTAAPLNPQLAPLGDNGGQTPTHRLLTGSPAIDKGNSTLTTDQRGATRPVDNPAVANAAGGNGSDIGAFEVQVPTAASVTVSGRVKTPNGKGLINAFVTLTDTSGNQRLARTTTFGYFRFEDVAAGETYIVGVSSKRYRFAPQVLSINQDIADLELTGEGVFFNGLR